MPWNPSLTFSYPILRSPREFSSNGGNKIPDNVGTTQKADKQ